MRRHGPDILIGCAIFATCLVVYNATLTPSLSYASPDGNELATVPYVLGLAHSTGYPLYTWLGKLFTYLPIGDVAHRMNLMSATLGAAGVTLLYAILRILTSETSDFGHQTSSRLGSAFAALLFGFSLTFWSQTGIAEVYAPNVFMVALTVLVLLAWARVEERDRSTRPADEPVWRRFIPSAGSLALLTLSGLVFGLSLGTHMSNLGFVPAFALFILLVSWRTALSPIAIGDAAAGFIAGLLQFLWLPYKASTLTDQLMRAHAPTTLRGIYNYTLGAFPQFKLAFPLAAIPDRIVIYLDFLRQQFGLWGIGLGVVGMWALLLCKPRRFFLFAGMYLVHVWFFIQYRVFDLDVFFIPTHLVYAVFIGYGTYWLLERMFAWVWRGTRGKAWRLALAALLALVLALPVVSQVRANWETNDRSDDTAINDFYENVFRMLPEGAALLGRSGVFGYDMFYFRLVYDVRPDVAMPHLPQSGSKQGQELEGQEVYTTMRLDQPGGGRGPWALPPDLLSSEAWYVPVLFGSAAHTGFGPGSHSLVLYHVTEEPPELVVTEVEPQHPVGAALDGLVLVGYDLESDEVEAGHVFHLTLYWQVREHPGRVLVGTLLDGMLLETHELGLGNLQRYVEQFHPPRDGVIVEDYRLVVPSLTEPGQATLEVALVAPFGAPGAELQLLASQPLQPVTIQPTN